MRKDKHIAIELRKERRSYGEIRHLLNIPKSTLSDWFRNEQWSKKVKEALTRKNRLESEVRMKELSKIRGHNLKRIYKEARQEARKEFDYFKYHPLFIVGITIYWGEGDKSTKSLVRVSNIDPLMVKLFIKFLTEVCGVEKSKIRASLLLYSDLNSRRCRDYWIKNSGLIDENFSKSIIIQGRHKTRRVKYGVCNVGVSSAYLKEKINIWLGMLPGEMVTNKYYKRP